MELVTVPRVLHVAVCWLLLLTPGSGVYSKEEKKCDVQMWYRDLVTKGPLSGNLSEVRKVLRTQIEAMVKKYTTLKTGGGKIDCNILTFYEDLVKADETSTSNDVPQSEGKTEKDSKENLDETEFDETDFGDEDDESEAESSVHTESETLLKDITEDPKPSRDNLQETKKQKRIVEKYVFDPRRGYVKVTEEINEEETNKENETTHDKETEKASEGSDDSHKERTSKAAEGKEENDRNSSKDLPEKSDKPKEANNVSKTTPTGSKDKGTKTDDDERGTSKISADAPRHKNTLADNDKEKLKASESERSQMSKGPSHSYEENIDKQGLGEANVIRSEDLADPNIDYNDGGIWSLPAMIQDKCSDEELSHSLCYYSFAGGQCVGQYSDIDSSKYLQPPQERKEEEKLRETPQSVKQEVVMTSPTVEEEVPTMVRQSNQDKPSRERHDGEQAPVETPPSKDIPQDKEEKASHDGYEDTHRSRSVHNSKGTYDDFKTDLHRFELTFQQRASEYASKIQNLEIMIIRLENQLLSERLDKQNDTNSFSKLENHILKLENELLKLNQSYVLLSEENSLLKSRQRKYLELGHDKGKQSEVADNNTKVISQQQSKISELATVLHNHSLLFDKLYSKSQMLEEQNQMLYQIVMNQTALISSIMKKMQEMSEENMKHRQQTQDLRTKLEIKASSDRILEKLDNLVTGNVNLPKAVEAEDGEEEVEQHFPRNIYNFLPRSPDPTVDPPVWTCSGKTLPQFCVLYSFILSPCAPYSTVYWGSCPHFFRYLKDDRENEQDMPPRKEDDGKPEVTIVNDEKNINGHIKEDDRQPDNQSQEVKATEKSPENNVNSVLKDSKFSQSDTSSDDDESTVSQRTVSDKDAEANNGKASQDKQRSAQEVDKDRSQTPAETPSQEQAPVELPPQGQTEEHAATSSSQEQAPATPPQEQAPATPPQEQPPVTTPSPREASSESPSKEQAPVEQAPADQDDIKANREILYAAGETPKPKDCYGYYLDGYTRNGMYKIYLVGQQKTVNVYCDMRDGGWTVFFKRNSGKLDFFREWNDYKQGFGNLYSEHWMGNDNLHYLTNQGHYTLRVDLFDFDREHVFAEYDTFFIDTEGEGYRLHVGGYSGSAGDGFEKHNQMMFSTKDKDNDLVKKDLKEYDSSCAKRFRGGWWYYKCYMSNLTGQYYTDGIVPGKAFDGISWKPWKKPSFSLKEVVLKLIPRDLPDEEQ